MIRCNIILSADCAALRAGEIESGGGTVISISYAGERISYGEVCGPVESFVVFYREAAVGSAEKWLTEDLKKLKPDVLTGTGGPKLCDCGKQPKLCPATFEFNDTRPPHTSYRYFCACGQSSPLYDTPARALEMWDAGHREEAT